MLGVPLEVAVLGSPLAEPVPVDELDPPDGNEGGVVGVEPDEQAETSTVASMARVAQPKTVPRKRRQP